MNNTISDSLLEYQVSNNDIVSEVDPHTLNIYRKKMCLYYLICLILGEITWTSLSVGYYQQKFSVTLILLAAVVWVSVWATIGLKFHFMHIQQYLFWIQTCTHTLLYIFAKLTSNYHFILCGSCTAIILFVILELVLTKKIVGSKFFLYLYLWHIVIFYDDMVQLSFPRTVSWASMLVMDVYWVMASLFLILIKKRYRDLSKPAKWQVMLLFYPWSLMLVLCLAGSFPQKQYYFKWIYFTIINHCVFLFLVQYIIKNKQIIPSIRIRKNIHHMDMEEDIRVKMYQISDVLLVHEQDHIQIFRQSMSGGRPLADCTLCYDQESEFCYNNCNHAVIGRNCMRAWLEKNVKKCPICRTQSNIMYRVERITGVIFAVNEKFRFKT